MLENYLFGLSKVSYKISSVPGYYDKIIENDQGYINFLEIFSLRSKSDSFFIAAEEILKEKISGSRPITYGVVLDGFDFVFFGSSPNNLKQFDWFLEKIKRKSIDPKYVNLSFIKAKKTNGKFDLDSIFLKKIIDAYSEFLINLKSPSVYLVYQLQRYTLAYINFKLGMLNSSFRVAVVSNDHSPVHVAFSQVAKDMRKKTIYIQHAEVNESFPPLNFDLSILNNQRSLSFYKNSGSFSGNVLIFSRFNEAFNLHKMREQSGKYIKVVLYLTSSINYPEVNKIIDILCTNKYVEAIYLKPHTRTTPSELISGLKRNDIDVLEKIPAFDHIAVVGNSSVVIELMNNSIKCFHNFDMDHIAQDTYGFCKNGLVPYVSSENLRGRFWSGYQFDENRLKLLEDYIPYISKNYKNSEVENDLISMVDGFIHDKDSSMVFFDKNSKDPINIRFCHFVMSNFPITFLEVFNKYNGKYNGWPWLDDLTALKVAKSIFNDRSLSINSLFKYSSSITIQSSLICWFQLVLSEWPGNNVEEEKLKEIVNYVISYEGHKVVRNELETKLLLALIRENKVNEMQFVLSEIKYAHIKTRNSKFKAAFVVFCKKNGLVNDVFFKNYYKDCFEGVEGFEKLRFKIYSFDPDYDDSFLFRHGKVVDDFLESSNKNIKDEFKKFVLPTYDFLNEKMSLMNVRFEKEERDLFFDMVLESLKNKTPFSMIRLSDGEGYIFHQEKGFFNIDDAINRERHWWGCKLNEEERAGLVSTLKNALEKVDVLGVPSVYRFLRDIGYQTRSLMDGLTVRGMLQILADVKNLNLDNTVITEELCNQSLFGDISILKKLFLNSKRVVFINSLESDEIKKKFNSIEFLHIKIPTHSRQGNNNKYYMGDKPLPYIYEEIRKEIYESVSPGDLVLVSGGIIGKIFISDAKLAGAVALDMGSALDNIFYFN